MSSELWSPAKWSHGMRRRLARWERVGTAARQVGAVLALLGGAALFLVKMSGHLPVSEWLFFRYAGFWAASFGFLGVSVCVGDAIVTWVRGGRRKRLPVREQMAMAFAVGTLAFGVGVFVFGILHLLKGGFFFWYPALLAVLFVPRFVFAYLPLALRFWRPGYRLPSSALWRLPLFALALALAYVPLITFQNISYDARWYHLPAAEHYAAAGGIERFPEGWILGAYPQIGTMFYTWAMTLPFGRFFDRSMLCVHIEWAMFIGTLLSMPVLVRRLAPKVSGVGAALSMFLFPGMLLYDSSLAAGADHLAAAYAPALWLALLRAWPAFDVRASVLLGLTFAAACLTKYTALNLVAPVGVAIALRAAWLAMRGLRRGAPVKTWAVVRGAGAFGLVLLGVTSIHWLKNYFYYRDPLFPLLNKWITPNPWSDYAEANYIFLSKHLMASAPHTEMGVRSMFEAAVNFAFEPHDWGYSHRDIPVFGALFTLSFLVMPFVKPRARIFALAVACELGVMLWFWTHHLDRFLQALLPWMAAVTAAVMGLVWKHGWFTRAVVFSWAALQVIWGGDQPFIPTHSMFGDSPYREAVHFLGEGYRQNYEGRLLVTDMEEVGSTLPKDAKILIHQAQVHMGLGRMSVSDSPHSQTGLDYSVLDSRSLYRLLRDWKVTHIIMPPQPSDIEWDSVAGNVILAEFLDRYGGRRYSIGSWKIIAMPGTEPPPQPENRSVFYVGCNGHDRYKSGLYRLSQMRRITNQNYPFPRDREPKDDPAATKKMIERADFLAVDHCRSDIPLDDWVELYRRNESTLYRRK